MLKIFERLGFIEFTNTKRTELYQVTRLLGESIQPLPDDELTRVKDVPLCTVMQSYHNLEEIFFYLWSKKICPRGSFSDLTFRLIIFQQSCHGLSQYPPMHAMNSREKYQFCEPAFFKLLLVLMISDSKSYVLTD